MQAYSRCREEKENSPEQNADLPEFRCMDIEPVAEEERPESEKDAACDFCRFAWPDECCDERGYACRRDGRSL